ncbi:MAG: hypothetical protein CMP39_04020 [Rickettsiales bacterium]|nr:hypothetical protein [Rickettsiales bacterium]
MKRLRKKNYNPRCFTNQNNITNPDVSQSETTSRKKFQTQMFHKAKQRYKPGCFTNQNNVTNPDVSQSETTSIPKAITSQNW